MLAFFYFVSPLRNFGNFRFRMSLAGMGETSGHRLLKNEESSDSIGITIVIIIDVNY